MTAYVGRAKHCTGTALTFRGKVWPATWNADGDQTVMIAPAGAEAVVGPLRTGRIPYISAHGLHLGFF